jgi:uncharacterized protein YbjT (DUF2867 family)
MIKTRKILLTGGTGFTGGYVLRHLLKAGYSVTVFARNRAKAEALRRTHGEFAIAEGSFEDRTRFVAALRGHDTLVNVASLGFGHAEMIVGCAEKAGIQRGVFFSTTALFTTLPAATKVVRQAAEDCVRRAKFPCTILRPTMICGAPGDRNIIRLIQWIDRHRLLPVFGPGTYRLQPVYVDDLAAAVVGVLQSEGTANREYNLSGASVTDYNGLVGLVGKLLGRKVWPIHLPVGLSLLAVRLASLIPGLPKLSAEQVLRLNEHKEFAHAEAVTDFGYAPTPLTTILESEIEAYQRG